MRCVLQRLQHSQPTMFCCSQLLSALPTTLQSNQPAIFLAAKFDGSLCERALHASTHFCKHASTCLSKAAGYCLCTLRSLHTCLGQNPLEPKRNERCRANSLRQDLRFHRRKLQTFETKKETQRVIDRETMLATASFTKPITLGERISSRPLEAAA